MAIHREFHRADCIGWLRAAVLGANDGTISVASLMAGVAASGASPENLLLTGVAGLVSGAMSMAAGEYVSVKSQADTEQADLEREQQELKSQPERELAELTSIYVKRGLEPNLAHQVAAQLMQKDALNAHARDELGITDALRAHPIQAALASALSFTAGAIVPVVTALLTPAPLTAEATIGVSFITLALLGGVAAYAGGAPMAKGAVRVAFWGALAMGTTSAIGTVFGATAL